MKQLNQKLTDRYNIYKLIREAKEEPTYQKVQEITRLSDQYLKKYGEPFSYTLILEGDDDLA